MYCFRNSRKTKALLYGIALISSIVLVSCDHSYKTETVSYYPIDSLLHAQELYLGSAGAQLHKTSSLGLKQDSSTYAPKDSSEWGKELDVLRQLGAINKPVNRGFYTSTDLADTKSNLRVQIFEAKKPDLPVRYLKVYYLGSPDRVKRIEGSYVESNELYESSRIFSVELQEIYNKTLITSYSVKGTQKMIFTDSFDFHVEGMITINAY